MQAINWRHDRRQLFLPVLVMPSASADNASHAVTIRALIDTGATKTGLREDLVKHLGLAKRDRAPIQTANGTLITDLHLARLGFWSAEIDEDVFQLSESRMPYVLDREFLVQALKPDFSHQMLLGMDVVGLCELAINSNGIARLVLP
jgi:predicted aspartyl protease